MSETTNDNADEEVGSVQVRVTKGQIHRSVRNVINEMKLDPAEVKEEVRQQAYKLIQTEVINYLSKTGYGQASLTEWANRVVSQRKEAVDKHLKDAVKTAVAEAIRGEVEEVVAAVIKDGIEVRIGWNRKVKVKVARAEESA